jgi:hypothetical protein
VFSSLLTRPYRLATRGAELGIRTTLHAFNFAGELATAVAQRVVGGSHNGSPDGQEPSAPGPDAPLGQRARPSTEGPPAPEPPPAEPALDAEEPASTPEPPSAARRLAAETRDSEMAVVDYDEPTPSEPAHVSEEPELVEEFAEPGAEEGAGAQLRILEPWEGYREMKADDIIQRLASASREELAAVELYELAGRNRKSVVAAAQRALKQASPPQ